MVPKETIMFPNEIYITASYYRPFMCYKHSDYINCLGGSKIVGGIPYRGKELKGYCGNYIFADWTQRLIGGDHMGVGNVILQKLIHLILKNLII